MLPNERYLGTGKKHTGTGRVRARNIRVRAGYGQEIYGYGQGTGTKSSTRAVLYFSLSSIKEVVYYIVIDCTLLPIQSDDIRCRSDEILMIFFNSIV
jgi:hypothetical protein